MADRPGAALARRPLHFVLLVDCSGSMAADGKMQALNNAVREALPHLVDVAGANPHAEMLVRAIAFSSGARWHVAEPTPVDELAWPDVTSGGYTDLGAAIDLLRSALTVPPMQSRALPPAIVLISDGMPTDEYERSLGALLDEPWGARSVRMAVGIGRDCDHEMLMRFMGGGEPAMASNPEQLVAAIRWASMHVSRVASEAPGDETEIPVRGGPRVVAESTSEVVW
ncbi:VWA domain-containing protein [Cellulomonas sp. URHD0024]|uniref:vWA domain-containing protein n=1 Tax=Cellulomonas sp. URHD0024 TaxID=1302620 RepID=UPI000482881E|nr:VWA domain-containing protein [Cellulomonas sp. URHD0024]